MHVGITWKGFEQMKKKDGALMSHFGFGRQILLFDKYKYYNSTFKFNVQF